MIRLNYLRESSLAELRNAVSINIDRYRDSPPFLASFFGGSERWLCESLVTVAELPPLDPEDTGKAEANNAIAFHKALAALTESQAADERLWVWLAHELYWDYMRLRWPIESARSKDPAAYIFEHYFLSGNVRNLVRHGLARLWWFAHTTHDSHRADPYELTRVMLEYSDNRQSVMERAFSRNRQFVQTILERARYWRAHGRDILASREKFRGLCKEMNLYGGTLMLDCLLREDIFKLVDDFVTCAVPASGTEVVDVR
ncbi:MAG: DUF6339 family protein [Gammaproteobacteria bacterium]|nr:DUF6339 family protein [Gammaproteobacteria bacterium]